YGLGVLSLGAGVPGGPEAIAEQWRIAEETAARHGARMDRANWRPVVNVHVADDDELALRPVQVGGRQETMPYLEVTPGRAPARGARCRPHHPVSAARAPDPGGLMPTPAHREQILGQCTRQAVPFSAAPGIKDEQALRLLVEWSGAGPEDTVLDVACGGGIVVCAFARVVRHATGIDLTPAMIERARSLHAEQGLSNVSWKQGDVLPLPWPGG